MEINLSQNQGYKWITKYNIFFKGYFFDESGYFYEDELAVNYFNKFKSIEELIVVLNKINGLFSIVIKKDEDIVIISDKTRTFPILYSIQKDKIAVFDNIEYIKNIKFSKKHIIEYLSSGYVTINNTLLENIYITESSSIVKLNKRGLEIKKYDINFLYNRNYSNLDFLQLKELFFKQLLNTFENIIKIAKGRQIVVPLSGGYDSRLIVALLKEKKYDNVLCFTYGKETSNEVKLSKKIANEVGYKWVFIPYDEGLFKRNWNVFLNYLNYSHYFSSVPHVQDFFAFYELVKKDLIAKDAIIIPGHSGDIYAGTHLPKKINKILSKKDLLNYLTNKYFSNKKLSEKEFLMIKEALENDLEIDFLKYLNNNIIEWWNIKERQSKFIVNSCRVYEYFNYQFLLPLWDKKLLSFFEYVPLKYRNRNSILSYNFRQNLYDNVIFYFFEKYNIDYYNMSYISFFKKIFMKRLKLYDRDYNNFSSLISLLDEKSVNIEGKNINFYVGKYILNILEKDNIK